jgi:hypothetical protein
MTPRLFGRYETEAGILRSTVVNDARVIALIMITQENTLFSYKCIPHAADRTLPVTPRLPNALITLFV